VLLSDYKATIHYFVGLNDETLTLGQWCDENRWNCCPKKSNRRIYWIALNRANICSHLVVWICKMLLWIWLVSTYLILLTRTRTHSLLGTSFFPPKIAPTHNFLSFQIYCLDYKKNICQILRYVNVMITNIYILLFLIVLEQKKNSKKKPITHRTKTLPML
jgi:hypothetical protein